MKYVSNNYNKLLKYMTLLSRFITVFGLLAFTYSVQAQQPLSGDYQACIACHGDKAQGNAALSAPALAGMEDWYITRQLNNFKNGIRGAHPKDTFGAQMKIISTTLNVAQINNLASELSKLKTVSSKQEAKGNANSGKKYYLSNCAACHGGKAQGNRQLNAPALNALEAYYMKRQLQNFTAGVRGSHAEDKYGKQMAMMAKTLPNAEASDDVIAFILTL
ncbi:MAG: c-type cytochrome [Kangiellaceae bacterium]|nr:c-type cytochrome [Kangiellaceae bacterium]